MKMREEWFPSEDAMIIISEQSDATPGSFQVQEGVVRLFNIFYSHHEWSTIVYNSVAFGRISNINQQ